MPARFEAVERRRMLPCPTSSGTIRCSTHGDTRPKARSLEFDRPGHRHHDRRRHLPHPGRHRHARARPGADARRLGARRIIVLCGALAFAELSAAMPETGGMYVYLREGWGRPYGIPLRMGAARADSRRRARRHLVGLRRVFPAGVRHRSGRASRRGPTISPPAPSSSPASPTSSACSLGALFAGISTIAKFGALALLVLASFLLGGGAGGAFSHTSPRPARPSIPGCSAWR